MDLKCQSPWGSTQQVTTASQIHSQILLWTPAVTGASCSQDWLWLIHQGTCVRISPLSYHLFVSSRLCIFRYMWVSLIPQRTLPLTCCMGELHWSKQQGLHGVPPASPGTNPDTQETSEGLTQLANSRTCLQKELNWWRMFSFLQSPTTQKPWPRISHGRLDYISGVSRLTGLTTAMPFFNIWR